MLSSWNGESSIRSGSIRAGPTHILDELSATHYSKSNLSIAESIEVQVIIQNRSIHASYLMGALRYANE
jgi:hypothetical protein